MDSTTDQFYLDFLTAYDGPDAPDTKSVRAVTGIDGALQQLIDKGVVAVAPPDVARPLGQRGSFWNDTISEARPQQESRQQLVDLYVALHSIKKQRVLSHQEQEWLDRVRLYLRQA